MKCQFCGSTLKKTAFGKDFFICPEDHLLYFHGAQSTQYENDYFEKEYENQYGKTYLADRANLRIRFHKRLKIFAETISPQGISGMELLEIGSAAGFFLETAQEQGMLPTGWEISENMGDYARSRSFQVQTGDFLSLARDTDKKFDVIAAFYVIEHFSEQHKVWKEIHRLLRENGFLLLAVPSVSGPLFRFHRRQWAESHPADHFVDYSPQSLKHIAAKIGFQVLHLSSVGIHPSRFPLGKIPGLNQIYSSIQKHFPLSDTIFAILKKS